VGGRLVSLSLFVMSRSREVSIDFLRKGGKSQSRCLEKEAGGWRARLLNDVFGGACPLQFCGGRHTLSLMLISLVPPFPIPHVTIDASQSQNKHVSQLLPLKLPQSIHTGLATKESPQLCLHTPALGIGVRSFPLFSDSVRLVRPALTWQIHHGAAPRPSESRIGRYCLFRHWSRAWLSPTRLAHFRHHMTSCS
jgi:hypothetical protein